MFNFNLTAPLTTIAITFEDPDNDEDGKVIGPKKTGLTQKC